jgi:hypothetical protein
MIEEIKNIKNGISDIRKFGITIGLFLIVIAGFLYWRGKEPNVILLISGSVLIVLGLLLPVILKPVYWLWMVLSIFLGWIMTRVILALLFYLVITPIGLFSRLFGNRFLDLKWDRSKDTYWNYRDRNQESIEEYEQQF